MHEHISAHIQTLVMHFNGTEDEDMKSRKKFPAIYEINGNHHEWYTIWYIQFNVKMRQ